jgi:ABC-type transport system involved in multi-copper enzyme maturation permease subunit
MTWVTWRQYRLQGAIALALLAAFAAAMLAYGFQMAAAWHSLLLRCTAVGAPVNVPLGSCAGGSIVGEIPNDLRVLSVIVPVIIGVLWGAPLVAHETETGTANFAWTQGITRSRWLLVKAGWLLLAAALCGAAVSALVTFWSGPVNAMRGQQFNGVFFDTQGLVPIGYAVFATALGIAAGTLLRRTLPAIAVTLGVFIGVRLLFNNAIRPHLMPAVTTLVSMTSTWSPPGIAWVFGTTVISKSGQVLAFSQNTFGANGIPITVACARLLPGPAKAIAGRSANPFGPALSCMQSAGYRQLVSYQPGWRYWPFQGIETAIYLLLAAALMAVAWYVLRRRDA